MHGKCVHFIIKCCMFTATVAKTEQLMNIRFKNKPGPVIVMLWKHFS